MSTSRSRNCFAPLSEQTKENYAQHIKKWHTSGLTQAKYCKNNNLNHNTFIYLRSKLLAETRVKELAGSKFAEARLANNKNELTEKIFTLHVKDCARLELPITAGASELFNIFSALGLTV